MKNYKAIASMSLAVILTVTMMTGCGKKKDNGVYTSENDSSQTTTTTASTEDESKESETESATTTSKAAEDSSKEDSSKEGSSEEDSSESEEDEITAPYIVNEAKNFIIDEGVLETSTHVEWTNIVYGSDAKDQSYEKITTADLKSGFNEDFYFIREQSETENRGDRKVNPGYEFYIDDDLGYIKYRGNEYKILSRIFLNECQLRNLDADTMAERFIKDLIIDMDELVWDESEDGKYYLIEQRIPYAALSINKANSCSFNAFDDEMIVRQVLKFDKETFKLVSSDVVCQYLDVSRNTEDKITVHSDYSYKKSCDYDSKIAEFCTELDSFKGYSIY